jgi:hypothetical protein
VNTAIVGDLGITFKKPPQPSVGVTEDYYVRLLMWDIYNINTKTMKVIMMTVKKNYPPDALPAQVTNDIPDVKLTYGFNFPISYKSFKDVEGDEIVFDCSKLEQTTPNSGLDASSWVKVTDLKQTGGTITLSGTVPPDN